MPSVFLPERNTTVNFPNDATESEMQSLLDQQYPTKFDITQEVGKGVKRGISSLGQAGTTALGFTGAISSAREADFRESLEALEQRNLPHPSTQETFAGRFEEEGFVSAAGLAIKKLPGQVGEQIPLFGAMIATAPLGGFAGGTAARIVGFGSKAGITAGRMLAIGAIGGGVEGEQTRQGIL